MTDSFCSEQSERERHNERVRSRRVLSAEELAAQLNPKQNIPTLEQVAKVAGMNRTYLGVIVRQLSKEFNIELPTRTGRPKKQEVRK